MPIPEIFIQIDEDGYGLSNEVRITDVNFGNELLKNLKIHESNTLISTFGGAPVIVEAFDEPLVAQNIEFKNSKWKINLPYDYAQYFDPHTLSLDEWDRFHGYTADNIPFVLSRKAQTSFFNLLTDYDDDSITILNEKINIPSYWEENPHVEKSKYWTQVYHDEGNPGWNLGEPAEALKDMLPRLKLPKSRIIVLGCGEGHDAALFAKAGHVVTAVDFSQEAIHRAHKNYETLKNISWQVADVFDLPQEFFGAFDYVFEHTCFCAINPTKRNELVSVWKKLLTPQGQLIGVFFTMEKRQGPPYGGSEWELRERLKKHFQFVFWGRWRKSIAKRMGRELFVLAQKVPGSFLS